MFSPFLVFSLLLSLLAFRTATALTLPARGTAAAEIMVTGQADAGEKPFVVVNGERAFNGRTFFSNGTISTTETSSATINLGKLGRIELAPSSSLILTFSDGNINGVLSKSRVSVSNVDGVSVRIDTPNDAIKDDKDKDDDDHWRAWAWLGVIGAAVVTIVLITTLGDGDSDTVSPVR